jgi:hypothetical protein
MSERFLIRTEGGPVDGETRVANSLGDDGWRWPLPDVLPHPDGRYVKEAESILPAPLHERVTLALEAWGLMKSRVRDLPDDVLAQFLERAAAPQDEDSRVLRGAVYRWEPSDA